MKIRRTGHEVDVRALPLDRTDMFLLTRIEGAVSLAELLAVSSCESTETVRRIEQLERLGVVKVEGRDPETGALVTDGIREIAADDEDIGAQPPSSIGAEDATKHPPAAVTKTRTFARPVDG